jgi:hypothetical protein
VQGHGADFFGNARHRRWGHVIPVLCSALLVRGKSQLQHIDKEIENFILRHIDSIAQLEALLLLRSNDKRDWQLNEIAQRLYVQKADAAEHLLQLCRDGFIADIDGKYRYAPTEDQKAMVDRLAMIYSRQLIPITNLIHKKPQRIRQFAQAFKFRKDS